MNQNTPDIDEFLEDLKRLLDDTDHTAAKQATPAPVAAKKPVQKAEPAIAAEPTVAAEPAPAETAPVKVDAEAVLKPMPASRPRPVPQAAPVVKKAPAAKKAPQQKTMLRKVLGIVGKVAVVLVETVLLAAVALYGLMFVLTKGPSPTAKELFVRSVRETSAVGWLANLYLSEDEIQDILNANAMPDYVQSDTSLIQIPKPEDKDDTQDGPVTDAWGLTDEDGDGIIVERVVGEGYNGYMMVVLDPTRVIMASVPESYGRRGYTVEEMVEVFDGVAGINAGGFLDPNGNGNGSVPDTIIVYEGTAYYQEMGYKVGFAGLDSNHILRVGNFKEKDFAAQDIQYGISFGPVLIADGNICGGLESGINPRTGIGQRSDGAMLLLVIDGRQANSLGATYEDMADIFASFGAVNAYNLDGGSSTMMWYGDEYLNTCASVRGIRPAPTAFVVLKEGADNNG